MKAHLRTVVCIVFAVFAFWQPGFAQGRNPGCVDLVRAYSRLDPADLGLGAQSCIAEGNYERAVGLIVLMQARMTFDKARIEGGRVEVIVAGLLDEMRAGMSDAEADRLNEAFAPLATQGGDARRVLCAVLRRMDPPDYVPDYVAQLDQAGAPVVLVAGFDAATGWASVIDDYMSCPTQ